MHKKVYGAIWKSTIIGDRPREISVVACIGNNGQI
jgi:hypothetical protein